MSDGEIEQEYFKEALQRVDKWQTAGFTHVRPRERLTATTTAVPDPLQRPAAPAVPTARPDFSDMLADTIGQPPELLITSVSLNKQQSG